MLLNMSDAQDSPTAKNHLVQNVNSAEADSPCPKGRGAPELCPGPSSSCMPPA